MFVDIIPVINSKVTARTEIFIVLSKVLLTFSRCVYFLVFVSRPRRMHLQVWDYMHMKYFHSFTLPADVAGFAQVSYPVDHQQQGHNGI